MAEDSSCNNRKRINNRTGEGSSHHDKDERSRRSAYRNGNDGGVAEGGPERRVQRPLGGRVQRRRRFVHDQQRRTPQHRPRHAEQLPLPRAETAAALSHLALCGRGG